MQYSLPDPTVINGSAEKLDMIRISKLNGAEQRRGYPDPHGLALSVMT
jgi:hypothetical protein